MNSAPHMLDLPQRHFLSSQCADAIRKAIANAVWSEFLPGERQLSETFKVSRPTIRTALRRLADEKLISIRHGRRIKLLQRAQNGTVPPSRLVLLVSLEPLLRASN